MTMSPHDMHFVKATAAAVHTLRLIAFIDRQRSSSDDDGERAGLN